MESDPRQRLRRLCTAAVQDMAAECGADPGGRQEEQPTGPGLQGGDGGALMQLLGRQAVQMLRRHASSLSWASAGPADRRADRRGDLAARRLEDLVSLAHARFYAYPPSQVPACWRQLYTDARILQFAEQWLSTVAAAEATSGQAICAPPDWDALVQALDMALILAGGAGPPGRGRAWIHAALDALHQAWEEGGGDGGGDGDGGDGGADMGMDGDSNDSGRPRKRIRTDGRHDWTAYPTFAQRQQQQQQAGVPPPRLPPIRRPVARADGPLGLAGFQAYLDRFRRRRPQQQKDFTAGDSGPQPLIIPGLMDHWPARWRPSLGAAADEATPTSHPWDVPAYLRWRTLGGRRRVPVEIGRSYVDAGWTQAVVPIGEVLRALEGAADGSKAATVYLAQHDLLSQIPGLREDIAIPDACYTDTGDASEEADNDNDPLLHAWLGPAGTISPLHTDPHHNLLAQVVGRKYVRLYSPEQTAALRPRGREAGVDMGNTSRLDVGLLEGWDEGGQDEGGQGQRQDDTDKERARFRQIPYVDCILEAGETLYIPRGWWHYVRGLSVSFSVSFWWN